MHINVDITFLGFLSNKLASQNILLKPISKHVPQICAFTSMTVVIISTLTFVLSTMPELAEEIDVVLFDNETEATQDSVERWDQVSANQHSFTFTYHIYIIFSAVKSHLSTILGNPTAQNS